jgi:hypothetical protein
MNSKEFLELQDADKWPQQRRDIWDGYVPKCSPDTFREEQYRHDGVIEVRHVRRSWRKLIVDFFDAIRGM